MDKVSARYLDTIFLGSGALVPQVRANRRRGYAGWRLGADVTQSTVGTFST